MGIEDVGMLDGNVQEGNAWVSEEEQARVREDMKKAAQMRGQIAQSAQHNMQYAQLLSVLLQYVNDDILLGMIFQQLITYKIEATGIFAQFMPFLQGKISLDPYRVMFESIWDHAVAVDHTPESLVEYMSLLRRGSEEIRKIPIGEYREMIVRMAQLGGRATSEDKEIIKLVEEIS